MLLSDYHSIAAYPRDSLLTFTNRRIKDVSLETLDTLIEESQEILYQDPRLARKHAEIILELASANSKALPKLAFAYKIRGQALFLEDNPDSALTSFWKAKHAFEQLGLGTEVAQTHNLMGACYQKKSEVKSAISFGFLALHHFRKNNGPDLYLASTLENLGNLFAQQQQYEEAQNYYLQALGIRQSLSDSVAFARTLLNIAEIEFNLKNFAQAKEYNRLALQIQQDYQLTFEQARGYQQLGFTLLRLGEWEKAEHFLHESSSLNEHLGNTSGLAKSKSLLGELNYEQGKLEMAESNIREAMGLAEEMDNKALLLPIYRLWAEILSEKGFASQARLWYNKAYLLRDSLLTLEHMNHLTSAQASLEIDAKNAENQKLKRESVAHLRQITFQQTAIVLFFLALVFILIMFGQVLKNRIMLKEAYKVQEKQKGEIERQAEDLQEANFFISRLNTELEKKIKDRTLQIVDKNRKLEQFAFDISHNIRSPLANMLGIIYLMKKSDTFGKDPFVKKLEDSAVQLDTIIKETNDQLNSDPGINN